MKGDIYYIEKVEQIATFAAETIPGKKSSGRCPFFLNQQKN